MICVDLMGNCMDTLIEISQNVTILFFTTFDYMQLLVVCEQF